MNEKGWQDDLPCLGEGTESSYHYAYVDPVKGSFSVAVINVTEERSNPFIYVYVNSSLNTSEEGTFMQLKIGRYQMVLYEAHACQYLEPRIDLLTRLTS